MASEEDALLLGEANIYGSKDNANANGRRYSRTPSLADTFADTLNHKRKPSRLEWAESKWTRWVYVIFWWWLNPIFNLSQKQTMTDDDLDDLPYEDKSSTLLRKLLIYDWSTSTTWRVVFHAFGKETLYIGLGYILLIAARIGQPLLIRAILEKVSHGRDIAYHSGIGIVFSVALFLVIAIHAFCHHHLYFRASQMGIRIRNVLSCAIYQHLLSIDMSSLQQTTSAQAVNLIANDATKFELFSTFGHFVWAAPLEAIITFIILGFIIGPLPAVFGLIVLLLLILLEILFGRGFSRYHQKTVEAVDQRIKAYSELLDGCHIIKMYNWEKPIEERILKLRENELSSIKKMSYLRAVNMALFFVSPLLMSLAAFGGGWLLRLPLKLPSVFAAFVFFGQVRLGIVYLMAVSIERLSGVLVASRRIDTFMRLKKKQPHRHELPTLDDNAENNQLGTIILRDASFSWGDNNSCLSSLNVDIRSNQLIGIFGSVGAGKSSFLAAILDEMNLTHGDIKVNGALSYAAQSTWIFADTLRANILVGKPFDETRYVNVLHACCLDIDLKAFGQAGDLIVIGEKGVNLSGGQKARVSLARALYVDADIYLLDDPLSAVDLKVAKKIFDNCIGPRSLLKDKTRLLVTHQTQFLSASDQCIRLIDGCIEKSGSFNTLLLEYKHVNIVNADNKTDNETESTQELTAAEMDLSKLNADTKSILNNETSMSGRISWSLFCRLFNATPLRWCGLILLIIVVIIAELAFNATVFWLAVWSGQSYSTQRRVFLYAVIYLVLTLTTVIVTLVSANYWFYVVLCGSASQHNRMLKGILYTSMRFFESNSVGRILNRASRDQFFVDEILPMTMLDTVQALLTTIVSLILVGIVNPILLIPLLIVVPLCFYLHHCHSKLIHQLKGIESVTRSPVYAFFSSSFNGLSTIRVLKMKDDFVRTFINRVDANTRPYLPLIGAICGYCLRLDLIAALFVLLAAILCIILGDIKVVALTAFVLTTSFNLVNRFQWGMHQLIETETLMISAERIDEYTELPPEEDNGGEKRLLQTPPDWPSRGIIEFRNYSLRYRPELEPVLNNLNLYINSNEKIGIIGRTGAGKSSIFQALFRFIERSSIEGEILIDDIDISRITLNHLRSHLSIIPQMPFLFSDTLRYNLDPFQIYTDEECFRALEDVQLKYRVRDHPDGLYLPVAESGSNFSVGERQLICLARAILQNSKILLIDEGTANVDRGTEALIQAVIKEKYRDRTILTIAHRLNTIAESDRILVMERGRVGKFDTPNNILQHE